MILPGCAVRLTHLESAEEPGSVSDQGPAQEEPSQTNEVGQSTLGQLNSPVQQMRLESPGPVAEVPAGQSSLHQGGTSFSIVTPPPQSVISKVLPDDLLNSPEALNLITPTLSWEPSTNTPRVGDQFTLAIEADQVSELFSAPFYLLYDPELLEFIGLAEGKFLKRDGSPTIFIYTVEPDKGQVVVGLSRLGEVEGISGSGTLALATFKAKNPGTASVAFQNVDFTDFRLEAVKVTARGGEIQIR